MSEPADFYTGLVAELYRPLRSFTSDPSAYASFIAEAGEPALELGCGDGEPLLDLRALGLDVDGVDSSADMLARLRRAASSRGLSVSVHQQRMEELDLPRRYRSIFLAGPTFNLLASDDDALRALRAIRAHLADDGTALVPLFVPPATAPGQLGVFRSVVTDEGATIRVGVVDEDRDVSARTRRTVLRYERETAAGIERLERVWLLHWHTPAGFSGLAQAAGLRVLSVTDDGRPVGEDAQDFTVRLAVGVGAAHAPARAGRPGVSGQ